MSPYPQLAISNVGFKFPSTKLFGYQSMFPFVYRGLNHHVTPKWLATRLLQVVVCGLLLGSIIPKPSITKTQHTTKKTTTKHMQPLEFRQFPLPFPPMVTGSVRQLLEESGHQVQIQKRTVAMQAGSLQRVRVATAGNSRELPHE